MARCKNMRGNNNDKLFAYTRARAHTHTHTHTHIKLFFNILNYLKLSQIFKRRSHGIPGVVGVNDGCHIPCKAPIDNGNDFYNRKGFDSIILQGNIFYKNSFY